MLFRPTRLLVLAVLIAASSVTAQIGGPPPPDPRAVLQQAKEASGGKAWDALRSQHSAVTMQATPGFVDHQQLTAGKSRHCHWVR